MAEVNYFDPPDPAANEPHYPNIEDRRRRDFGDWEGGRWLDPHSFQHVMDMSWRLNPGTYLAMEPPPLGTPITPLQRDAGVADLDRARAIMEKLREVGTARRKEAGRGY